MKKLLSAALLCLASALPVLAQKAVTNLTNNSEYDGLTAAINAAASGDVLQINQNIDLNTTINPGAKEITLQGANQNITVKIGKNSKNIIPVVFNINSTAACHVKDITFDMSTDESTTNFIQQTNGSLSIENVIIKDFTTSATNGAIRLYNSPVSTTIDNLTFANCSFPETAPYNILIATASSYPIIKGKCDFTVRLNNTDASFCDGGITSNSQVGISYSSHTETIPVVKDCDDIFKFNLNVDGKMLSPKENSLYAVNKTNILLINEVDGVKTGTGYSALAGSAGAATNATTGAVIVVNENVNLTTSMNVAGKSIEIRGAKPDVAITLAADRALANAAAADTHIAIRDLAITPQAELAYTSFIAQATTSDASVSFQNVTFKDCNTTNAALIRANAGGVWHIDGVTFENCSVTPASKADGTEVTPLVLTNNPGCSVSGINNGLTIQVNNAGTNSIDAQGLEAGNEPIILTLSGAAHDHTLITNCENLSLFEITNSGWSFQADEQGGLKTLDRQIVTGIEEVAAEADGEAEYYDLRGVRVNAEALTPGLYICRKGGKVSKTVIR